LGRALLISIETLYTSHDAKVMSTIAMLGTTAVKRSTYHHTAADFGKEDL